jgi:hypothetical protein
MDPPTCGPSGDELVGDALRQAFLPWVPEVLAYYYRRLRIRGGRAGYKASPRLETVLEIVKTVHGGSVLDDVLASLDAPPNPLHRFFADHLALGGLHITTNFDTCIERAGGAFPGDSFLHVHGVLGGDVDGATLAGIERGLSADVCARLSRMLLSPRVTSIVFVGYSGSDFFDVDPFLASLPSSSLSGRHVLWIEHGQKMERAAPGRRQLRLLNEAGAHVREVCIPTRSALREIGTPWGASIDDVRGEPQPRQAPILIREELQRQATIELFALMGLHREVDALLDPCSPHDWELRAQTRWAQGRYAEAGAAWERAGVGGSPAARAERAGAVAWIRGEYRRAHDLLTDALANGDGSFEERLTLVETLARVYLHMRRSPDSRLLATPQLRAFVLRQLSRPPDTTDEHEPLGIHLKSRIESVSSTLGVARDDSAGAVESFGEYEALNAQLNYRQGELRARAARGFVQPDAFSTLRRDFEAIGADGDAARAVLLGGPLFFPLRELVEATRRLQVTRWQRCRLLGSSLTYGILRGLRNSLFGWGRDGLFRSWRR